MLSTKFKFTRHVIPVDPQKRVKQWLLTEEISMPPENAQMFDVEDEESAKETSMPPENAQISDVADEESAKELSMPPENAQISDVEDEESDENESNGSEYQVK